MNLFYMHCQTFDGTVVVAVALTHGRLSSCWKIGFLIQIQYTLLEDPAVYAVIHFSRSRQRSLGCLSTVLHFALMDLKWL
jgi:hypothetical protein